MLYNWTLPDKPKKNKSKNNNSLKIPPIIKNILYNRNIKNIKDIYNFINPELSSLHDPFLMKDMEKAVTRICLALEKGENILIYGDYDVDGVTSVSILFEAIYNVGGKVSFFIPDRNKEGYGLSIVGVEKAVKRKSSLIITVDCGITAYDSVNYALSLGIDTIICDHHEMGEELPNAIAVLDPKVKGCSYPFRELAGCGVAFKLIQGLAKKLALKDEYAYQFLDLVALGSSADIVDIVGENRILVYHGLKAIREGARPGISELISICGFKKEDISVRRIVFSVAPRINAAGRISLAKKAVHLLTSKSQQQAKNIAQILNSENRIRKKIDESTLRDSERLIADQLNLEKDRIIVLEKESWHLGVIGIVASRILEKYHKPTILISVSNGVGTASARSNDHFNIINALKELKNILISFGGHEKAAGLSIRSENINLFREKINFIAQNSVKLTNDKPFLNIDSAISVENYNAGLFRWLNMLAPYGPGNMRPVFITRELSISGPVIRVGEKHLKFKVNQNGFVVDAIAYNMDQYYKIINDHRSSLNFVYVLEENDWQGQITVQLRVKDFEVNDV